MDIDTDKTPPKTIDIVLENIKDISFMVNDLKNDIAFIKSKIREIELKKDKEAIEKSWWIF